MMMGNATLDGRPLFEAFGALLMEDSIGALLRYPTRETVRQTDFAETNGIQVDLRRFRVQRRRITLSFGLLAGSMSDLRDRKESLIMALRTSGWHTLDAGLGISHRLRYVSMPSFLIHRPMDEGANGATLTVTMEEDAFPAAEGAQPVDPGINTPRGIASIDGVDFAAFGASIDADYTGAMLTSSDTKEPFSDGRKLYVEEPTRAKAADFVLYVDLAAKTREAFAANWAALYAAFAKPDTRRLEVVERGASILMPTYVSVFYRDCSAAAATVGTGFGLKMQIKLTAPVIY